MENANDSQMKVLLAGDIAPVRQPVDRLADLIKPDIVDRDYLIAQCERVYSERGAFQDWVTVPRGTWSRLTEDYASVWKAAGVNVASVASNHALDYGIDPFLDTIDLFRSWGINVMGGGDQVSSLKQFVQFGLDKQMAVGGALFELESIRAVPDSARVGWWTMEWWWDQPGVPHVAEFNASIKKVTGSAATARNWFGYASVQTLAVIANQEKTLDAPKLAHALSGFKLPPEIALQPGAPEYRAGDHQLMSTVFVGEAHPPQGDPDNMFTIKTPVPGEKAAGSVESTGCKIQWPA